MKQKPIFNRWQTIANDYIFVLAIFLAESVKFYAFFFVPRCDICIKNSNGYSAVLNHGFNLFGQLKYILLTEKAWTDLNSIPEDSLKMSEIPLLGNSGADYCRYRRILLSGLDFSCHTSIDFWKCTEHTIAI